MSEKRQLTEAELEQRRNAARRPKTMTDAAIAQRQAASALSTGPKTEEGKAASSRNNWRHGQYSAINKQWREMGLGKIAKPCKSTCNHFATCTLIAEGLTQPGQDCLDKTAYLQAFDTLMDVMTSGDISLGHSMLAHHASEAFDLLAQMRKEIAERGVMIERDIYGKTGDILGSELVLNPVIREYHKLLGVLGINLGEMMATPMAASKVKQTEDATGAVADLFSQLANVRMGQRPRIINATPDDDDD